MKSAFTVVLAYLTVMVFAGGCEKQQAPSDVSLHRLIAAENRELKAQLQDEKKKQDDEIKNLESQCQAKLQKRDDVEKHLKEQIAQCEQAKQNIVKSQEEEQKRLDSLISDLSDWNSNLTNEVRQLKAELAKTRGQQ